MLALRWTRSKWDAPLSSYREPQNFNGMIQHTFALPLPEGRWPFDGWTNLERIAERFNSGEFRARPLGKVLRPSGSKADHSPVASSTLGLTTHDSIETTFIRPAPPPPDLPPALDWAWGGLTLDRDDFVEPRLIFADRYDDERNSSINDFIVTKEKLPKKREATSQLLLELMAHKRSRLFGFPLANRFVNVLLPHAVLRRRNAITCLTTRNAWFLQPLVSFIRGGRDRGRLRNTYALTFFLIPVVLDRRESKSRSVSAEEINDIVNPGWGFAAHARKEPAKFDVSGPLLCYLSHLARFDLHAMSWPSGSAQLSKDRKALTLRQAVERVAFGVNLSVAQGKAGKANVETTRRIGNDVITALGSARVSSVVVVDPDLKKYQAQEPIRDEPYPGSLKSLMETLAEPARIPMKNDKEAHRYRLDRPMVDGRIYVTGVLPVKRCIVILSREDVQHGVEESALMQAGSIAYMTIGAAMAIGAMRQIDRRLEYQEDAENPRKIAKIDAEIASDLGEIHDLDVTRESYREVYRLLRKRLGIARDYKILQNKMESLFRATATVHEDNQQRLLLWLTVVITILTVLAVVASAVK